MTQWHRLDDPENPAPRDGTEIWVTAGRKTFRAKFDRYGYNSWVATTERYPREWDDGVCWLSNAADRPSPKPRKWASVVGTLPPPPKD